VAVKKKKRPPRRLPFFLSRLVIPIRRPRKDERIVYNFSAESTNKNLRIKFPKKF